MKLKPDPSLFLRSTGGRSTVSRTPSPPHSYRCPRFFCTLNLTNCSTGSQQLLVEVGLGLAALPPWDGKTREIQGDFNLRLFCLQMVQIFQTGTLRAGPGKRLVIGDTGDFQVHLSFFLREKFPVDAETFFYIILQSKPPLDLSEHPRCQTLPAPRPKTSTRYP